MMYLPGGDILDRDYIIQGGAVNWPWKTLLSVSWLESRVPLYTSLEQYGTQTEDEEVDMINKNDL